MSGYMVFLVVAIAVASYFLGRNLYWYNLRIRRHRELSHIFASITHELLTPLTVVSASVDNLREKAPDAVGDYDLMQLNIQRMVRLLQQIVETSRSQAGELRLSVAHGDVMRYIHETALCLVPLMQKNDVRFDIRCQPESMMGWIDTDKLDKIVYNLLSNAAKYTGEHGEVALRVSTNETYDHIVIRVSDTGIGLTESQKRHLFERFLDVDYDSHADLGNGLGLAITRDLVALHGGTISCDSQKGLGSTFTVELPISKESFAPDQIDHSHLDDFNIPRQTIVDFKPLVPDDNTEAMQQSSSGTDAVSVLLVEDNIELLMLMKQRLKSHYRVLTATNGKEALSLLGKTSVDVVVSDVLMPVMGGYELTRAIRRSEAHRDLPVMLLTTHVQEEGQEQAQLAGADDCLFKPFRLSDLRLHIDNMIATRRHADGSDASGGADAAAESLEPTAEQLFVERATQCVINHLDDPDYGREAFAADMNAGSSSLYNKVRATTGMNVVSFIRHIRMTEAQRIVASDPTVRVSDLAWRVGYRDPKYFATTFKKEFGITPSEFIDSQSSKQHPA